MSRAIALAISALVTLSGCDQPQMGHERNVRLQAASLFGNHMVLQQDMPVPLWGWANPGSIVSVEVAGQTKTTTCNPSGRWQVTLDPLHADAPTVMTIRSAGQILRFDDVLIGEVWLCSGQSNMQMSVAQAGHAPQAIATADHPQIRLFTCQPQKSHLPMDRVNGQWVVCNPQTVGDFSAVGYFFGRTIHQQLKTPVGLIDNSWGGSCIQAWTSRQAMNADALNQPFYDRYREEIAPHDGQLEEFDAAMRWLQTDRRSAIPALTIEPGKNAPSALYNGMLHPLIPYALRGVAWYQGESNANRGYDYRRLFPQMIADWRKAWAKPDLPFVYVQLPIYGEAQDDPNEAREWSWQDVRESQLKCLAIHHTAMAVTIDEGEADDPHPKNKQIVAQRLAAAAEATVYGLDVPYQGPLYRSMTVEGDRIRLQFDHVDGGWMVRGIAPTGFVIAGSDQRFAWANAKVEGNSIVVWSSNIPHPVAVRYGWAANPRCNLYNAYGFPASPFRTDDWPILTQGRH